MGDHGSAAFIRAKFQTLPDLSSQPCIYKAPDHLREVNEECYRPYVISIGPFYYGHPPLKAMQDCKWMCLKLFLEHDSNSYRLDLEHYLTIIRDLEASIRDCYAESISLSSDDFVQMILADCAFIICNFMRYHPILSLSPVLAHIIKRSLLKWRAKLKRDLFLEENQIPFFVLERLFQEAFGAAYPHTSFLDLACTYIAKGGTPAVYGQVVNAVTAIERIKNGPEIKHLVDLLRNFCFPSTLRVQALEPSYTNVRFPSNVSNLRAAGVRFIPSKSMNLLDITFCKGVMQIPLLQLCDVSESFFRSVILFEQSHLPITDSSYFVDYMILLEKLIRTPEDVKILVQSGIIDNLIGSEETIAIIFNGITKHLVTPNNFYYRGVCEELNSYANTRWNQWKAILKKDYFSHPWATISVVYAFILLLLSLLQTVGTFTNN
ncbi:hypothetical protein vseg_014145 [Gypsophila vaccaria]